MMPSPKDSTIQAPERSFAGCWVHLENRRVIQRFQIENDGGPADFPLSASLVHQPMFLQFWG